MDKIYVVYSGIELNALDCERIGFASLGQAEKYASKIKESLEYEYINSQDYPEEEECDWKLIKSYVKGCVRKYVLFSRAIDDGEYTEEDPEIHIYEWKFVDYPRNIKSASKK